MRLANEEYLGDGLYVSFDGWYLWLRAPRNDGDHRVALEPPVFQKFKEYAERVHNAKSAAT
jgi:hypothetical protein